MKSATQIVCVAAIVTASGLVAMTVQIDTVTVGNPDNAAEQSSAKAIRKIRGQWVRDQ